MTTIVKIHRKGQMTLPSGLREMAGIAEGDLVQAVFHRGKIVLTPTLVIDRAKFSSAAGEYTPEQRRIIDARLDKAEKSRPHGPFNTADEMITHMKAELKKRATTKKLKRPR